MGAHPGKPVGGGLRNKLKTHCAKGHPFDEENTVFIKNGKSRTCRICRKASNDKSHAKRRRLSHANKT